MVLRWIKLLLLLSILSKAQSAVHILDADCSTKPLLIGCHFSNSREHLSQPEGSGRIDWGDLEPEDVGIFDLIKPNTTNGALALESRIRWRLPIGALPHALHGFEIVVTERYTEEARSHHFRTKLSKPIHRVNNAIQHAEFYIKTSGLFHFGKHYNTKISFLPSGDGGMASIEKNVPPWPENVNCDPSELRLSRMRKDRTISPSYFASMWSSAFRSIELYPARAAVNITFATAPKELCISAYKVRLRNIQTDQTLTYMRIEAEPGIFAWNLFEPILPEVGLVVEIVPDNNEDGSCPCINCNCVTTSSKPFTMEKIQTPQKTREQVNVEATSQNDPLWIFALILLAVVVSALCLMIALVAFYHRKLINTERHIKLSLGKTTQKPAFPAKEYRLRNVLLIDRSHNPSENQLCEKLARVLAISGVRIRFEAWEKLEVEENVFQWISQVLREVDSILMVYGKDWDQRSLIPSEDTQILSLIKPTDPRLVHISWSQSVTSSPFIETIYSLPRHASLLCGVLNIGYKATTWKQLVDACDETENGYANVETSSHESESERVALLGEKSDSGMDEEVEDPSIDPISYPSPPSPAPSPSSLHTVQIQILPTNLPQAPVEADSAYASLNTAELS